MQRSGSQKVLLVISIISIIFAVLGILAAVIAIIGGAAFSAVDAQEVTEALAGSGLSQGEAAAAVGVLGVSTLISSTISLITGILGVRAANDNRKIMPVWVLCIIQLILCVIGIGASLANGSLGSDFASIIVSLLLALFMFWIANNIKRQAGK